MSEGEDFDRLATAQKIHQGDEGFGTGSCANTNHLFHAAATFSLYSGVTSLVMTGSFLSIAMQAAVQRCSGSFICTQTPG
jgi:hypothetical protein